MKGIKRLECKLDGVRVLAVVSGAMSHCTVAMAKSLKTFRRLLMPLKMFASTSNMGVAQVGIMCWMVRLWVKVSSNSCAKHIANQTLKPQAWCITFLISSHLKLFKKGTGMQGSTNGLEWLESARAGLEETTCLRIMPGLDVNLDTAEGHDIMQRYAEAAVEGGFEGIMIKSLDAPYECKRSDSWMKWKPTISVDLNIVGFEEGTGRNENRLGAIICEGDDNDRRIHVNVGSGFSDTLRDEYWASRDQLLGHLVEVQADAVTQNQDGTYSLRFPRFLRFRDFEAGEKV
jgi:hypothetical protein